MELDWYAKLRFIYDAYSMFTVMNFIVREFAIQNWI